MTVGNKWKTLKKTQLKSLKNLLTGLTRTVMGRLGKIELGWMILKRLVGFLEKKLEVYLKVLIVIGEILLSSKIFVRVF